MSHGITKIDSMAYAKETPWHGIGEYVGEACLTSGDMIRKAGLDWTVEARPMATTINGKVHVVSGHVATVCPEKDVQIGVVGDGYKIVQNADAFGFLDNIGGGGEGRVVYETAGSLNGLGQVWMLARFGDGDDVIGDDRIVPYMLLATSHDGSLSLTVFPTAVRVVCANTLGMALSGSKSAIRIRHTANAEQRMKLAEKTLAQADKQFADFLSASKTLARKQISAATVDLVLDTVFGAPESGRAKNIRAEIMDLFNGGAAGSDIPGVSGTAWGLFNAVTEYVTHNRSTTSAGSEYGGRDNRFASSMMGSGADLAAKMMKELVKV
jgi:phage/plasmid-like protein (TIGR03299 family)